MDDLSRVRERIRTFVEEREWNRFHDPKNLAMAVASEAGELVAELRWVASEDERLHALTNHYDPPAAACASWRGLFLGLPELERDLMRHVHLENDVVFPLACALEARVTGERTV